MCYYNTLKGLLVECGQHAVDVLNQKLKKEKYLLRIVKWKLAKGVNSLKSKNRYAKIKAIHILLIYLKVKFSYDKFTYKSKRYSWNYCYYLHIVYVLHIRQILLCFFIFFVCYTHYPLLYSS